MAALPTMIMLLGFPGSVIDFPVSPMNLFGHVQIGQLAAAAPVETRMCCLHDLGLAIAP